MEAAFHLVSVLFGRGAHRCQTEQRTRDLENADRYELDVLR